MKKCKIDTVDFHAHILPHVDHGSDSTATSLSQLTLAAQHGVSRVIATSHFYPHRHLLDDFVARRERAAKRLMSMRTDGMADFVLGAEVLICDGIERLDGISQLCVANTMTLLLELPFTTFSSSYVDAIERLTADGYDVIMAHADRYNKQNIELCISVGARLQLNADSLCRPFRRRHLFDWLERGCVVALGSDIHGPHKSAYSAFVKAQGVLGKHVGQVNAYSDNVWNKARS